jgi:hypothetical protein
LLQSNQSIDSHNEKIRINDEIINSFYLVFLFASLSSRSELLLLPVCRGRQSLKLQLTNYVIMISMMMNDSDGRGHYPDATYKQIIDLGFCPASGLPSEGINASALPRFDATFDPGSGENNHKT